MTGVVDPLVALRTTAFACNGVMLPELKWRLAQETVLVRTAAAPEPIAVNEETTRWMFRLPCLFGVPRTAVLNRLRSEVAGKELLPLRDNIWR